MKRAESAQGKVIILLCTGFSWKSGTCHFGFGLKHCVPVSPLPSIVCGRSGYGVPFGGHVFYAACTDPIPFVVGSEADCEGSSWFMCKICTGLRSLLRVFVQILSLRRRI